MVIKLPENVKLILDLLDKSGYEAYIVGGCVRDSLMNKEPHDWDICTSALPKQMEQVFKDFKIIPTGLKHGTLSIVIGDELYEVTTFRIDGEYEDNRHPKDVEFVSDIKLDLMRRDFTINAMAYNEKVGIVDLFGGQEDINNKVIKCVGNPDKRFNEDALRIMRAIRFAAIFDFDIDEETHNSMVNNRKLLKNVSVERICSELTKTLEKGIFTLDNKRFLAGDLILCIREVDGIDIIPCGMFGCIVCSENNLCLRLAILFDNIEIEQVLKRLRFSNEVINQTVEIHKIGYRIFNNIRALALNENRLYFARKILSSIKYCSAHEAVEFARYLNGSFLIDHSLIELQNQIDKCIENKDVVSISGLAINGNDLINIGIKGKDIGVILNNLLDLVMSDKVKNNKSDLIEMTKSLSP